MTLRFIPDDTDDALSSDASPGKARAESYAAPIWRLITLAGWMVLAAGVASAAPPGGSNVSAGDEAPAEETPHKGAPRNAGNPLTLEGIFASDEFAEQSRDLQWDAHTDWLWAGPNEFAGADSDDSTAGLVGWRPGESEASLRLGEEELTPAGAASPLEIEHHQWTADRRYLLVMTNSVRVWRANTRGDYWLLDRSAGRWRRVGEKFGGQALMFATFSPDGRRIAYVAATQGQNGQNRGLYVETTEQAVVQPVSVTSDPAVIDGTFDWVNEEELGLRRGFRFSPDGSRLAFWQVDTTGVPRQTLIDNTSARYPNLKSFAYPKVGQPNSAVRLGIADLISGEIVWADLPGDPRQHYLPAIDWAPASIPGASGRLIVQQLNRPQNVLDVFMVDCESGRSGLLWQERSDTWVTPVEEIRWRPFSAGDEAARLLWSSERSGFRHLYEVSLPVTAWSVWQGDKPPEISVRFRPLTAGRFDVESVLASCPESGTVYVIAAPDDPTGRRLYRVDADSDRPSENLSAVSPRDHGTYDYQISPSCQFAVETWSDRNTPPIGRIVGLQPYEPIRPWVDNAPLRARLESLPPIDSQFLKLEIPLDDSVSGERSPSSPPSVETDEPSSPAGESTAAEEKAATADKGREVESASVTLDAWISLPPDHSVEQARRANSSGDRPSIPLLIYVYGEPAGQTVVDRWRGRHGLWHRYLNQQGIAVATIDNRGTASPRGQDFRHAIHGRMGVLPPADLSAAVDRLLNRFPVLDRQRVAVWGWSGGGSTALHLVFRHPDQFAAAIAVAPVADSLDYDTIYQERYYGLLDDHAERYRKGSPIEHAAGLQDPLLIIHGTGDDNVHYASTERLVNRLVELDKPFQMMVYPGRSHSISEGAGTALHQRKLMTRFLVRHLLHEPTTNF